MFFQERKHGVLLALVVLFHIHHVIECLAHRDRAGTGVILGTLPHRRARAIGHGRAQLGESLLQSLIFAPESIRRMAGRELGAAICTSTSRVTCECRSHMERVFLPRHAFVN